MYTGWTDEQIEGWKIMLERNVCLLTLTAHPPLSCISRRNSPTKTKSSPNTNSRATVPSPHPHHMRCTEEARAGGDAGAVGGDAVVEVAEAVVKVEVEEVAAVVDRATRQGVGRGRTRTKRVGRTITGRGGMIKRWRGSQGLAEHVGCRLRGTLRCVLQVMRRVDIQVRCQLPVYNTMKCCAAITHKSIH